MKLGLVAAVLVFGGAASAALAFQDEAPSKLPIDVPKDATVTFEADGPGKKFMPIIKHLISGDLFDPSAPPKDSVKVKTPLGDVDVSVDEVAPILEKIHYLHIVTYNEVPGDDPFKTQQKFFTMAGLSKVTSVSGSDGLLVMRHSGKTDQFGIVAKGKGTVAILRSDGGPGLGDIGKVALESLARLVGQAKQKH